MRPSRCNGHTSKYRSHPQPTLQALLLPEPFPGPNFRQAQTDGRVRLPPHLSLSPLKDRPSLVRSTLFHVVLLCSGITQDECRVEQAVFFQDRLSLHIITLLKVSPLDV